MRRLGFVLMVGYRWLSLELREYYRKFCASLTANWPKWRRILSKHPTFQQRQSDPWDWKLATNRFNSQGQFLIQLCPRPIPRQSHPLIQHRIRTASLAQKTLIKAYNLRLLLIPKEEDLRFLSDQYKQQMCSQALLVQITGLDPLQQFQTL